MDSRLEHVDFDSLLQCLTVDKLLQVFASILLERRVILIADKLRYYRCREGQTAKPYHYITDSKWLIEEHEKMELPQVDACWRVLALSSYLT